jgi:hypothetical protein
LINRQILQPQNNILKKLITFAPIKETENIRKAIFAAGGGHIGNYSECSFSAEGEGTFKGEANTKPFVGKQGERHTEKENKIEVIFPTWLEIKIITALLTIHPYEEVAYDIIPLENKYQQTGSGIVGELPEAINETSFLTNLKKIFNLSLVRHTSLTGKMVKKVALCGGAGSFLINAAIASESDFYITSDVKYHEFFDANGKLVIADIGHYESEQFTIELLYKVLSEKFLNFAVLKTGVKTNPVQYFL